MPTLPIKHAVLYPDREMDLILKHLPAAMLLLTQGQQSASFRVSVGLADPSLWLEVLSSPIWVSMTLLFQLGIKGTLLPLTPMGLNLNNFQD